MSVSSGTNKCTSRLVVVLQLATWSAVSIVLLQKGVSSLQRRTLEATNVSEADPSSIGAPSIQFGTVSSVKDTENKTPRQSVDKIAEVVIRFNTGSARRDWNRSGLNVIRSELGDEFEIVSEERRSTLPDPLEISTTNPETSRGSSSRADNRLSDEHDPIDKSTSSRFARIIHDKIVGRGISANIRARENIASPEESVSQPVKGENSRVRGKDINFPENTSRSVTSPTSTVRGKADQLSSMSDSLWRRKDEAQFSRRVSASGAAMAVAMVVIGTIMLLLGPAVIVLRLLDERRRARKSQNELSDDTAWQDLPPTYEQVVLMNEEAPRYSTLVFSGRLDDDARLSPSPPMLSPSPSPAPSPTPPSPSPFSHAYGSSLDPSEIKLHSCR
ncbi:PREDICTED: uncharacterized protein LOC106744735 [Dinoponera quadriceps]|uniref:Uncharacterized protein LOC106744735 n=1 Tax=Dinoponera quadriceps TaxID=609295 RepID=A0A6P3XAD7_DINQU|nr:PREDICTED: uncharacterized protein LOC106744735 [Dinoponera quadriceps]XP_014475227.1 PREDICTED: uncharacterized protein LOC106744735 [Dinoponera quadriceps]XP_014475228.1 PREDICTED: uncharacterized protein LOC106744735 [Dinoponera quadriceps]XP_014475229.1 PREDICTED: uncharacterized protein LOC106744735 [Dinoponera quadriceps]XP_014475230.1 PREDICTED: uncharacterized protein LOC106744735 [Dinoponera quadriceps]